MSSRRAFTEGRGTGHVHRIYPLKSSLLKFIVMSCPDAPYLPRSRWGGTFVHIPTSISLDLEPELRDLQAKEPQLFREIKIVEGGGVSIYEEDIDPFLDFLEDSGVLKEWEEKYKDKTEEELDPEKFHVHFMPYSLYAGKKSSPEDKRWVGYFSPFRSSYPPDKEERMLSEVLEIYKRYSGKELQTLSSRIIVFENQKEMEAFWDFLEVTKIGCHKRWRKKWLQ